MRDKELVNLAGRSNVMSTEYETSLEGNKKHNYEFTNLFLLQISLFGHAVLTLSMVA